MKIKLLIILFSFILYACQMESKQETSPGADSTGNNTAQPDHILIKKRDSGQTTIDTTKSNFSNNAVSFVQAHFADDIRKNLIDSTSRKMMVEEVDLNNDGQNEVFVGLAGPYFCGTGGCTMLLFDNSGKIITRFTVVQYPVGIDNETTGGWKNLILESKGGSHLAKYNGKAYPSNPSVLPKYDLKKSKGIEAIFVQDDVEKMIPF